MYINSQLATLRGTILELSIPSGAKTDTNKGIPPRDVVEYISQGEFATSCLKLAKSDQKVHVHNRCTYVCIVTDQRAPTCKSCSNSSQVPSYSLVAMVVSVAKAAKEFHFHSSWFSLKVSLF